MPKFPYYMLCVWTFIHIGRPQDIFPFLVPFHLGDISASLTLISYFLTGQQGEDVRTYPEIKLFFILAGYGALCIPFGYFPRKSVEDFLFDFVFKLGLYLWLTAKLINSEERVQGLLKTLMYSGFAMAISAIVRMGTESRVGGGGAYDPNDLAMVLVTTLPIAIMQGLTATGWLRKLICFGGGALNLLGIIATKSRGGFLGLLALGAFMMVVTLPGISRKRLILLLTTLSIVFGAYLGTEYRERIATIFEESTSDVGAGSGRVGVWRRALQLARDHPILGVGPGAFTSAFGEYLEADKFEGDISREGIGGKWQTAHNSFLLILAEMGIPGFIIYLVIIIRSFRNLTRAKKLESREETSMSPSAVHATSLQMALVGFLSCAFFLSQSYNVLLYLYFFLTSALLRWTARERTKG